MESLVKMVRSVLGNRLGYIEQMGSRVILNQTTGKDPVVIEMQRGELLVEGMSEVDSKTLKTRFGIFLV